MCGQFGGCEPVKRCVYPRTVHIQSHDVYVLEECLAPPGDNMGLLLSLNPMGDCHSTATTTMIEYVL